MTDRARSPSQTAVLPPATADTAGRAKRKSRRIDGVLVRLAIEADDLLIARDWYLQFLFCSYRCLAHPLRIPHPQAVLSVARCDLASQSVVQRLCHISSIAQFRELQG